MRRGAVRLVLGISMGVCGLADHAVARTASLLPTQQRIKAPSKEVDLGLFPTGIALSSDGRLVLATNNGFLFQSLTAVDTDNLKVKDQPIGSPGGNVLFIGVALAPDGRTGYASGHTAAGYNDVLYPVTLAPGPTLKRGNAIPLPRGSYPAGLAMSKDGNRLYVAENLANKLGVLNTHTNTLVAEISVGRQPWGVALHPMLPQAYVTNRDDRTVSVVDTETMRVLATLPTGSGPNAVAVSPNGAKIFVADAHSDDLTVFDVNAPQSVRRISLSPFEGAQRGSSPNALAFAPDGSRLYVANTWDNAIVVIAPDSEQIVGGIPTGWYPSAIAVSPDNKTLYVSNMKGSRSFPRTRQRQPLDFNVNVRLGGTYGEKGTLSILRVPTDRELTLLAHRTVGTVIGPYVRRHYVTHTRFGMASMHRTMELILGLPPMSQFDQMAIPMRELFTDTPNTTPYAAVPASFPFMLTRANRGAAVSAQQDWSTPDRVPDELLNQLLWDYLKGSDADQ